MFLQVKKRKDTGQMMIFIPKNSGLKPEDWVKVNKQED